MTKEKLEFETRTAKITIDYSKCLAAKENTSAPPCKFLCVKACHLYGRNVLKIEGNKPVLSISDPEEIKRLDNECLACEYNCSMYGSGCIKIELPLEGLEEYVAAKQLAK